MSVICKSVTKLFTVEGAAQHCRVSQRGGGLIEGCGTGPSAVITLGDRTRPGSSQKLRAQT